MKRPELRFKEIVEATGLNKSTAFNLISTMEYWGFLEQDETTKAYRLGTHLMRLGEIARKSVAIIDLARPYMEKLRDEVNETVQLARLQGAFTVYLEKVESDQPIKTYSQRGDMLPAYATGLGKAMLAYKGEDYVLQHFSGSLKRFTGSTIGSGEQLLEALREIRREGISKDDGEYIDDLVCYAAPIFDYRGRVEYAISVSVPSYRLSGEKEEAIQRGIRQKAGLISRELGYMG